ncbi:MAG: type VI secretion system baseplate subunit TssF [Betaproteobacteria bacterium]|nr:type VI secretion system baseplate subunit TssF [Betaproteobacteria bacterium]
MSLNRYYQNELIAFRELGQEFARRNPALAPFFDSPGRDPDVERILESFAFLTGRLHNKLDDELPEITHSLFSLLWPHYLRPIPACSILRYQPSETLSGAVSIKRGTVVESVPVEGTRCRFRTAYDTEILPLRLTDHRILEHNGKGILALHFEAMQAPLETLPITKLRFFLAGEKTIAHTIYYTLATQVREVRVVLQSANKEERITACLSPAVVRPVGFNEDEGIFPYPANAFPGYRIIQEYFCFTEKFFFIEVNELDKGLNQDALSPFKGVKKFQLHFVLDELPEQYESFRTENWQLFCTPVVNLFSMDSSPLLIDQHRPEYRIVPDPGRPYHFTTYSVDKVRTWTHDSKTLHYYKLFESFEHYTREDKAYYRLRIRPSTQDESTESYISIIHLPDSPHRAQEETLSLELTCTNRLLPKHLGVGDICFHAGDAPDTISCKNITPVEPPYNPPLGDDLFWRLLSKMSLNYIPLANPIALQAVLSTYDFRAPHDRPRAKILEKNLKAIVSTACTETGRIYNGLPVRGMQTRLVLDQKGFSCEGDMYLFGSVLNEFLALYATVNSFHQLVVNEAKLGEEYVWPARLGRTAF